MKVRRFLLVCIAAALALILSGCSGQGVTLTVSEVSGAPAASGNGTSALAFGDTLKNGDTITLKEDAHLCFSGAGCEFVAADETTMVVKFSGSSKKGAVNFELLSGALLCRTTPAASDKFIITVNTPHGTLSGTGLFTVRVFSEKDSPVQSAAVSVFEGSVIITADGSSVELAAGKTAVIGENSVSGLEDSPDYLTLPVKILRMLRLSTERDSDEIDAAIARLETTVETTGMSLEYDGKALHDGETISITTAQNAVKLVAVVEPENATYKNIVWSSDNAAVATVSDGEVKGLSAGTARITATTQDGSFSCYVKFTVTKVIPVESVAIYRDGVNISGSILELTVGDKIILNGRISPPDAENTQLYWKVEGTCAEFDKTTNTLAAVAAGDGILWVNSAEDTAITNKIILKVKADAEPEDIAVYDAGTGSVLAASENNLTSVVELTSGESLLLSVEILPDGSDGNITWSFSDPLIASVDINGRLTALSSGNSTVTVKLDGTDIEAQFTIKVTK